MIRSGKRNPIHPEAGFTLLEILVSVTLVAMMAVGLWAVFRISIRSWARGTEFIDANQRHRSILDMVRKQLASAYPLFIQPSPPAVSPPYLVFSGSENSIQFISLNSLQFQESPGLTLVSYEVIQDSNGEYALVEKEARYSGQLSNQEDSIVFSRAIPIFENLASCTFEYFDPDNTQDPWIREWEGQNSMRLPLAVSITMFSRDPKGNLLNRHMVVPLQAQTGFPSYNFVNPFGNRVVVQ
jgi:prepilin-type N-terminal cleavage/methylation domain-containing protein